MSLLDATGATERPAGLLPRATIFDCDGTLADVAEFYHLFPADLASRNLEAWDPYHAATAHAKPITWVHTLAQAEVAHGTAVIVVTARDERWRPVTEGWLTKHPIPHTELLMRAAGDRRHDAEIKAEILADLRTRYDIQMAVDDRPSVIDFWRANGVPTVVVPGWPEHWPVR